jgi:hypothetical protein
MEKENRKISLDKDTEENQVKKENQRRERKE